jgi:hypothetical protein
VFYDIFLGYLITAGREITGRCIITIMNRSTDPDLVRFMEFGQGCGGVVYKDGVHVSS